MEHILRLLARHGFGDVIANLHYFPDMIREPLRRRLAVGRAAHLLARGGAARHGRRRAQRARLLRRRDLPDHLRRRAHGHRPDRALGARTAETGGIAHAGAEARRRPEPARGRDRGRGRPHPGLPGEAGSRPRRSRTSATAASTCSSPRSSTTSPTGRSWTGRRTSSRPCSSRTSPFYGHEIAEYWNDIGNIKEFRQGNFDALDGRGAGAVSIRHRRRIRRRPGDRRAAGVRRRAACEIAARVRLTGPVVLGARCRVGGRVPRSAEASLWPGTERRRLATRS